MFRVFGRYLILLGATLKKPENGRLFYQEVMKEMNVIGIGSVGIISFISVFIGAVTSVQAAYHLQMAPTMPRYMIAMFTRNSVLMELGPTICSLVLAGNVGSSIASHIGTMRVTEQIDALEIMGINSAQFLVLPKVIAGVIIMPMLIIISIVLSLSGGMIASASTGMVSTQDFLIGLMTEFDSYLIVLFMTKSAVFAFIITTVASFQGYFTSGGAKEVGESSTQAVVYSCVLILLFDYIIVQVML